MNKMSIALVTKHTHDYRILIIDCIIVLIEVIKK
jgi:hypothetical protein